MHGDVGRIAQGHRLCADRQVATTVDDEAVGQPHLAGGHDHAAQEVSADEPRREGAAGCVEQLDGGASLRDPARLDDSDVVRERHDVEQVVGDEQDAGRAAVQQVSQDVPHVGGDLDVEGGQGFVEQEQVGLDGERAGEGDALRLAAGQLGAAASGQVGDVEALEPLVCAHPRLAPRDPLGAQPEGHVAAHVQVGKGEGVLAEQGDAAPVRRQPGAGVGVDEDAVAEDHAAAVGPQQAGDDLEDRGLARTVGADEGGHPCPVEGLVDDDPALRDLHAHLEGRHATRSRALGRCTSPTTTPATTTRTSESATAAAGSVSRWR